MSGIFSHKNPEDLLSKLRNDLERLRKNKEDKNAAIDFFITAESLTDWVYPGRSNKNEQKNLRNSSILLQIVSHIASNAKHFKAEAKHHISVSSTSKAGGYFGSGYFASSYFSRKYFPEGHLVIMLEGKAEEVLGESITALALAEKVVKYWELKLKTIGGPRKGNHGLH
jgi:hypothetical protein